MRTNSLLKGNVFFDKYIKKHLIKHILILTIYLIGFLIGIGVFNQKVDIEENTEEILELVTSKIEYIGGNTPEAISIYIKQDYFEIFVMCILSFSIIGVPLIMVLLFIDALSLGTSISSLIYTCGVGNGFSFSILTFLIPSIIKVCLSLILICSSIKFVENILMYKKELKYELVRHSLTNIIVLILTCVTVIYRIFSLNIISKIMF